MFVAVFVVQGVETVHLSETRSATQAVLDFNAHYHNGALKCGSILRRWVK